MKNIYLILSSIRLVFHLILFKLSPNKIIITNDIKRWCEKLDLTFDGIYSLIYLLTIYKEYRNVFYLRIGPIGRVLNIYCPEINSLFIHCKNVGEGLFIRNGFSTIILAESIGSNCDIYQQVTIGYAKNGIPTIGNNVQITAGAKIIGDIIIGDNVIVGANTVVNKNVRNNCVVVGVPGYIVKRNGIKVHEKL